MPVAPHATPSRVWWIGTTAKAQFASAQRSPQFSSMLGPRPPFAART
ncbi:hypothetical protein ACFQ0M_47085 [Kitasatospora aburaviensis]